MLDTRNITGWQLQERLKPLHGWVAAVARKEADKERLLRQLLGAAPFEDREMMSRRI
jgi:hypothetical protein